jgi:hypothetical protein
LQNHIDGNDFPIPPRGIGFVNDIPFVFLKQQPHIACLGDDTCAQPRNRSIDIPHQDNRHSCINQAECDLFIHSEHFLWFSRDFVRPRTASGNDHFINDHERTKIKSNVALMRHEIALPAAGRPEFEYFVGFTHFFS